MNDSEQMFFDPTYALWHRGASVDERLDGLRERLPALCTREEIVSSIGDLLHLKKDRLCVAESAAATFISREMIPLPGTGCITHKQTPKARIIEDVLKKVFPKGAHFTQLATTFKRFPVSKQLEARNAHATLSLNPQIVLWGRGTFRHKDSFRLDEARFAALIEKIDEMFLPGISVVSAMAIFERYRSLVVQMGIPNSYALYGCLEWRHPKQFLYRHYPDIESLKATRRPKTRRVHELEAILADSDRPLSVDEIIAGMGSHRRLKDHHVIQRLPESKCVLLYDAGCYAHESVLGINSEQKAFIQGRARAFLRLGAGYATTKEIRLSMDLPKIKLPWTLRLLGSVLEQDPELTRVYNIVALGRVDSWETLLGRIVRDAIGHRPGITLDDLNEFLLAHEFVTTAFNLKTFPKMNGLVFSDGYIRVRA